MNIKHFPQRAVRQDHWGDYEWRDTMQTPPPVPFESIALQTPPPAPFESIAHQADMQSRAQQARKLLVCCCVAWALCCLALLGAAVVVS